MLVKIVKCSNNKYWYVDDIGKEYNVVQYPSYEDYWLILDNGHAGLLKSDCEVIEEPSEIKTGKVTSSDCVCKEEVKSCETCLNSYYKEKCNRKCVDYDLYVPVVDIKPKHTENKARKTWEEYDTINYGSNIHGMGIYVESHNKEKSWLDLEVATDQEYVKYCKWLKENNYLRELMLVQNTWDYNAPDKIADEKPKDEKVCETCLYELEEENYSPCFHCKKNSNWKPKQDHTENKLEKVESNKKVKKYKYVCKGCYNAPCKLITIDDMTPVKCPYDCDDVNWKLKGEV